MSESQDQNLDYAAEGASVVDIHDAVRREKVLPPTGQEPLTFGPLILAAFALILGAGFLGAYGNGFRDDIYVSSYYTPDPRPPGAGGADLGEKLAWIDQWMKDGKNVYANCIPCHQATGTGQPGLFPPLKGSEWVNGGTQRLGAIMMKGITGPFTVNGQGYNNVMAPWDTLGDEKVAQVLTYVRRSFGTLKDGDDGIVTTEMVKAAREEYKSRATPWDEAGLRAIPEEAMLPGSKIDPLTGQPAATAEAKAP
jgi:mono/diheme cytochrome c family protein